MRCDSISRGEGTGDMPVKGAGDGETNGGEPVNEVPLEAG